MIEEITYTKQSLDNAIREIFPDVFKCRLQPFEYMERVAVKCFLYTHLGETNAGKIVRKAMIDFIYYGKYKFQELTVKENESIMQ